MKVKTLLLLITGYMLAIAGISVYTEEVKLEKPLFADHYIYENVQNFDDAMIRLHYVSNYGEDIKVQSFSSVNDENTYFYVEQDHIVAQEGRYEIHEIFVRPAFQVDDGQQIVDVSDIKVNISGETSFVTTIGRLVISKEQQVARSISLRSRWGVC